MNSDKNYEYLREFTNSLITIFHQYATIRSYSVYFEYLLVYRYSDSLPTNTNKQLFGHFRHSYYSVRYSMDKSEGKKRTIRHYIVSIKICNQKLLVTLQTHTYSVTTFECTYFIPSFRLTLALSILFAYKYFTSCLYKSVLN